MRLKRGSGKFGRTNQIEGVHNISAEPYVLKANYGGEGGSHFISPCYLSISIYYIFFNFRITPMYQKMYQFKRITSTTLS